MNDMTNKFETELTIKNMKDGRYEIHCPVCKISIVPGLPCPVDRFAEIMQKFERDHAHDGTQACRWVEKDDYWETSCGKHWSFIADGPTENGMNYCNNCGRPLLVKRAWTP